MQLKNDLWDFALNFYQQPDVEQHCLALQEQYKLSVNRLIYACWSGVNGYILPANANTNTEADDWQREFTHPLRQLRYGLRAQKQDNAELESCYQKFRQAELACEQVELALLYQQAEQLQHRDASLALVEENLKTYLKSKKVPIDKEVTGALRCFLQAANSYLSTKHKE